MAGDWIKMRIDLQSHPKVVRILSATQSDKFRVLGGLHAVWSVFDTHSEDGVLNGYTPQTMDHIIGWPGFCNALIGVQWLAWDGQETLSMPEFTEHNGQSAKRRAEDQKRKKKSRQSVRNSSADDADKKRTREEKRRSNTPLPPSGAFERFWAAYPKRRSRDQALKAFAKINPDEQLLAVILAAIERAKTRDDWRKDDGQFIPYPASWLNAGGWKDEDAPLVPVAKGASW